MVHTNQDHIAALESTATDLGKFLLTWAAYEALLEVAIWQQLKIAPLEASMITASLQFKAKCHLLISLLKRDAAKNKDAIKALSEGMNFGERNLIVHGVFFTNSEGAHIFRRKCDGKFTSQRKRLGAPDIREAGLKLLGFSRRLQGALRISDDEFSLYFQTAHNDAARLAKSPLPPFS